MAKTEQINSIQTHEKNGIRDKKPFFNCIHTAIRSLISIEVDKIEYVLSIFVGRREIC